MTIESKLEIKSWDEKPYRELDDGTKFSRADVVLSASQAEIEAGATSEMLLYYRPDGSSDFSGYLQIDGRIGAREGNVVLRGTGTYDGTEARVDYVVVDGSGTGDLEGVSGSASSVSTHADYPYLPLVLDLDVS